MFVRLGFTEFLPVFFSFLGVADETEGRPPGFTEFRSVLPSFHVLKRRFIASQCFKPCFTGFLPSFTGLSWVLPSFTGFSWVLPSFTEFFFVIICRRTERRTTPLF